MERVEQKDILVTADAECSYLLWTSLLDRASFSSSSNSSSSKNSSHEESCPNDFGEMPNAARSNPVGSGYLSVGENILLPPGATFALFPRIHVAFCQVCDLAFPC